MDALSIIPVASGPSRNGGYDVSTPLSRSFPFDSQGHFTAAWASAAEAMDTELDGRAVEVTCRDCPVPHRLCRACWNCPTHCRCEETELRQRLTETREINRLDGRVVAGLIHEIDH